MWLNGSPAVHFSHDPLADSIPLQTTSTSGVHGGQLPLFKFKPRHETINWRRISAIDVDRVAHDLDFVTLQENIMNITFCNMDAEKCPYCQNPLDPTLLKIFRLAQLTIEYLLHSQEYLTANLQMYEEKLQASEFGKEQIKKELCNLSDEMKSQKQECKRRKQIISSQQMMIQSGANNYYKCPYCDKTFMNSFFLQSHIQRRHPNNTDVEMQKRNHSDKIQDEINQLKKQLQHTQSQLEAEKQLYFKTHSQELEKRTMKENETTKSFERWKEEEKKKLNSEMEKMKEVLAEEFKEMTEKNAALERELLQIKHTSMQLKSSLGALKNEHEHNIQEESRRYQQEVKDLKNILEKQEHKWTSEINSLFERHDHEKQKLQLEIERLMSSITKNHKANSCYYKKKIKELNRKLRDQQLIAHQKEELKTCSVKSPEKKLEPSSVPAILPRQKTLRREQPVATYKLEPIKELCEENEDMKHLPEVSTCNEDLRKVLKKNPNIVKELHKIVEQSLAEKLENLGIKPGVQGISEGQLMKVLDIVDSDREEKSTAFPNFYLYRESLSRKVEDKIKGKEELCHLKSKFENRLSGKSDVLSKVSQPSCSKTCKKKSPSPKLSSTTLSTTSSASDEFVGDLSSDTTSTESSENQMSETCELEEICTFEDQKTTENNSVESKSFEKGLTEIMEEELNRRLMARADKSLKIPVKKVVRELKFAETKNGDVWEVSPVDDDKCRITKPERERDSSAVAKTDQSNSGHVIKVSQGDVPIPLKGNPTTEQTGGLLSKGIDLRSLEVASLACIEEWIRKRPTLILY